MQRYASIFILCGRAQDRESLRGDEMNATVPDSSRGSLKSQK
jgi:hypothetical protein